MWRAIVLASVVATTACVPPTAAPPSPSTSPSATVAVRPSTAAPTPTAAATPTAPAPRDDLAARFHPQAPAGWRPAGPTVLLETSNGIDTTLVAVSVTTPLSPGVTIATFSSGMSQLRSDGTALAVALQVAPDTSRLATWDIRTGVLRWVTPDEPGVQVGGPVWSSDRSSIFYGASKATATSFTDVGIFRIAADGTGRAWVHGPDGNGGLPEHLTPDGRGLVWSRIAEGGSVDVLDLAAGTNRTFDPSSATSDASWRAARPRGLVLTGVCCAGPPGGGGTLHLWDDVAGTASVLLGPKSVPPVAVDAADWDPSGTRIATVVYDRANGVFPTTGSVAILDPLTGARQAVPGTDGAVQVRWLSSGIVYKTSTFGGPNDLILVAPDGSAKASLYHSTGTYPFRIAQVIVP
jgi:hypothetical protein